MVTHDDNREAVLMGSFNGVPTTLKIEHATGYLKAKIKPSTLAAPSVTPTLAARDDNREFSSLGSFNGTPKPLMVQHSTGYLRAVNA